MSEYSGETKAAVMAALLAGQSVSSVAKEFDIPRTTVQQWKIDVRDGKVTKDPSQKKRIGDLLLENIETNLITLRAHAEYARDTKWLSRQSASELAVFDGVLSDKTYRLIELLSSGDE